MLTDQQKLELQKYKGELMRLHIEIAAKSQHRDALAKIVAGYEELEHLNSPAQIALIETPDAPNAEPVPPPSDESDEGDRSRTFTKDLLNIISTNNTRRGISFDALVSEAKVTGLKTGAATFELGVRYALNALKKQNMIRSPKRGFYKPTSSKKEGEPT